MFRRPAEHRQVDADQRAGRHAKWRSPRSGRRPLGTPFGASCTANDFQIILVDTPGLHRPRTLLGKRLNDLVRDTYTEVDVIGLCIPADEAIGPGDRWIVEQIRSVAPKTTLVVVVTKIDKVSKDRVAAQLVAVSELVADSAEIVPVSAATGEQVDVLIDVLAAALPAGPAVLPRR